MNAAGVPARRPVELSLTADRLVAAGQRAAGGAIVAMVPADAPWYADRFPHAVVRATRNRAGDCSLEHLRLTPMSPVDQLPGLLGPWPSLVADSASSLLRIGAASVDVVLLRAEGAARHDMLHPALREQLLAYLPELWGNIVLLPDLSLAPPRATVDVVRAVAPSAAELFLVFCLDLPRGAAPGLMADALTGADAALCTWAGEPEARAAHGWRSAAAVVAGLLSTDLGTPGRSLCRRPVPLLPPRWGVRDRRPQLTPAPRAAAPPPEEDDAVVRVEIDGAENVALVRSEMSLRRPRGAWPLPALYCAKFVRRTLTEAADRFVFRPVTEQEAIAFGGALGLAVRPFVQRGMLVGPGGSGAPTIDTAVVRDPNAPGLAATISGYLRPWMLRVSLQVRVASGDRPSVLEV